MHTISRRNPSREDPHVHDCLYLGLLDACADSVIVLDASDAVIYANRAAERTFGPSHPEDVALAMFERVDPGDAGRIRSAIERARTAGAISRVEYRAQRHEGGSRRLEAVVQRGPTTEPGTVLLFVREAAEGQEDERQQEAESLAVAADASAAVARDVDNFLLLFGRHVDAVAAIPEPEARAEAQRMRESIDRAWDFVNQLQSFTRPGHGEHAITVDIDNGVEQVAPHLARLAGPQVEVIHLLGTTAGAIAMSRAHLEELLSMLIVRARDAMPDGGRIVIETRDSATLRPQDAALGRPRPGVIVEVTDTGVDMSAVTRVQLESGYLPTALAAPGGRVHRLVTRAGGRVTVESSGVSGTTVRLHFPVVTSKPPDPGAR